MNLTNGIIAKQSILLLAIAVGVHMFGPIALAAGESCDGPVYHPASTSGTCPCSLLDSPGGGWEVSCSTNTITIMNSYYSCGGNTTQTCDTMVGTVGNSHTCAVLSYNNALYTLAVAAWLACEASGPKPCGPKPMPCDYTTCGYRVPGTPISGSIYSGSDGTCGIVWNEFKRTTVQRRLAILASSRSNESF